MKIFDRQGNILENPDLEKGRIEIEEQMVTYKYVVTIEEKGHYEVVREYPNGGKTSEWIIDVPEEGSWVAYDESGKEIVTDRILEDEVPHEMCLTFNESVATYVPYTEEELVQIAEEKAKALEPTVEDMLNVLIGLEVQNG